MPPRKRTSSVRNDDTAGVQKDVDGPPVPDDALTLAEEAEAEAAEADAVAAAARARARAIRLRRQAAGAAQAPKVSAAISNGTVGAESEATAEPAEIDEAEADEAAPTETEIIDDTDTEAGFEAAEKPVRRRRLRVPRVRRKVVAGTLAILLTLGFLGASGYMIWQHRQVAADQQQSAEFAAAARQGVVTLMSLDFNSAEKDVKRILDNTTGEFRKDFESQADDFTKIAQKSKVVTEATVNATAVQSMTADTATVLVAVTTRLSNAASKEPQPRSWRLKVDVARDGGQIKLAKVEFVT